MSPAEDQRYFAHRALDEHAAHGAAKGRGSRVAHAQLALAYEARVGAFAPMIAKGRLPNDV